MLASAPLLRSRAKPVILQDSLLIFTRELQRRQPNPNIIPLNCQVLLLHTNKGRATTIPTNSIMPPYRSNPLRRHRKRRPLPPAMDSHKLLSTIKGSRMDNPLQPRRRSRLLLIPPLLKSNRRHRPPLSHNTQLAGLRRLDWTISISLRFLEKVILGKSCWQRQKPLRSCMLSRF